MFEVTCKNCGKPFRQIDAMRPRPGVARELLCRSRSCRLRAEPTVDEIIEIRRAAHVVIPLSTTFSRPPTA